MINLKIRKIIALIFGGINIFLAFIFHGIDFGIFIFVIVTLALWHIWFKKFVARYNPSIWFNDEPWLIEILGWTILCAVLFYNIIPLINK